MYHRFGEDQYPTTSVTLAQLEAQLRYLEQHHFNVIPLEELVLHVREGRELPDKSIAITIDDAYRSVYDHAFPRFKNYGWPFTVFVSTAAVDEKRRGFMSWEQMRAMQRGGATFANHSSDHGYLAVPRTGESSVAWEKRVTENIQRAQGRLEAELGSPLRYFAYPYGEYSVALADVVKGLGFVGFGQQSGAIGVTSDPRWLPRFPVNETYGDIDDLATKLNSLPFSLLEVTPLEPNVSGDSAPLLTLTFERDDVDLRRLACYASGQGKIAVEWHSETPAKMTVRAPRPLAVGRSRYNCTAPHTRNGRYFWFSHLWIRDARSESGSSSRDTADES